MDTCRGLLAFRLAAIKRFLIVDVAIGRSNSVLIWVEVIKFSFFTDLRIKLSVRSLVFFFCFYHGFLIYANVLPSINNF